MAQKIFIDGEVGTTGLQIATRLEGRSDIELIRLDEAVRKDPAARRDALRAADIAILCLPDAASVEAYEMVQGADTRLLDASTAHRVADGWVYGFAEMTAGQGDAIADARYVANPGCYPTGAIALLRPLREAGLLPADTPISVNAVSGYTGGGKAMIAEFEGPDAPGGFVYATAQAHKHLPELTKYAQLDASPIFVPSVGHFAQGMIVQIPLHLATLPGTPSLADLHGALAAHYDGSEFVSVLPLDAEQGKIDAEALNDTNQLELRVCGNADKGQAILVAVLDNLGKGASGAAVQNLNLMMGVDPKTGL
ncbi:N-acetyl-gamma-glutamyl-phosphate reductase [Actibacterium atlanticum]|uniref:N-acetyl-gamma-glutamyl-phosphate reductase n=1 Tax=Actibacterium atlanticum TaxID=1461693 RepID=A0A058ZIX8_9RHOB|nr:N-acetyl-gamma-glutamyl-phosphate reductase [Actibacterium atlanticum]KCV81147.1 N-acetyl-gamma-glutamyl-phosphate reductase [Actibacterium atlanticum]